MPTSLPRRALRVLAGRCDRPTRTGLTLGLLALTLAAGAPPAWQSAAAQATTTTAAATSPATWTEAGTVHQLLTPLSVPCDTSPTGGTDSDSGWHIQLVVTTPDPAQARRATTALARGAAAANAYVSMSSRHYSGPTHTEQLRFATAPTAAGCVPTVITLPLTPPAATATATRDLLEAAGLAAPRTIYLTAAPDIADSHTHGYTDAGEALNPTTVTDTAARYGVVWASGEDPDTISHELLHTLGAVAPGAPHATAGGHCSDGIDLMCYDDHTPGGYNQHIEPACTDSHTPYLDCDADTYFNPTPKAGTWLATHPEHNTALSPYLEATPGPPAPYREIAWHPLRRALPGLSAVPDPGPVGPADYQLAITPLAAPSCRTYGRAPLITLLTCAPAGGDRTIRVSWRPYRPGRGGRPVWLGPATTAAVRLVYPAR